ncbi:MAG: hypothetical protein V4857_14380 [Pseudomonadota bacterium]
MNPNHPLTARRIARILAALEVKAQNAHDMAASVCMCVDRARNYLMFLERAGQVHVRRWELRPAGNHYPVAVYALGKRKSAEKPPARTAQQKQAACRARLKDDKEGYERMRQSENMRRYVARKAKTPASWASALGLP